MRALSLFFFVISLLAAGQAPPSANQPPPNARPEDKCVVEGSVVNGVTGEPLKKAHVVLRPADHTQLNSTPYGVTTDASGHFVFDDVDPGKYWVTAGRNGFANSSYGEKRNRPDSRALLTLAAGQKMRDVIFHMTPQGVITGHVLDEDAEPIPGVNITCMRTIYSNGEKGLLPAGGGGTNDKGEYRVFGLAPGKYFVQARLNRQDQGVTERRKQKADEESYVPTFYPGVATGDAAMALTVTLGAELSGTDIKLIRTRTVSVGGKVTNRPNQYDRFSVELTARNGWDFWSTKRTSIDPTGNFQVRGVVPGAYVVRVTEFPNEEPRSAVANIEVTDSDVSDLQLPLAKNPDITGKIKAEGQVDFSGPTMYVHLQAVNTIFIRYVGGGEVNSDQTFKSTNVGPERYSINVFPLPDGCYVKSYRWGDSELPDGILDLTKGVTAGELSVLISANAAQIGGSVHDANQQPSVGAIVVLVPDDGGRRDLYKQSTTDQDGRFTIKQATPGKYKLYAFDDLEPGADQDPEYMKPFESRGVAMDLHESAKESKDLLVISTDDAQGAPKPNNQ